MYSLFGEKNARLTTEAGGGNGGVLFDFWAPRKNRSFFFSIGKRRNPIK